MSQDTEKTTNDIDQLVSHVALPVDPPKDGEPLTVKQPTAHPENTEDAVVEQIERQDAADELDEKLEQEAEPEEPMLIVTPEKHKFLARLARPMFWFKTCLFLLVVLIFAWLITPSRLWLLNTVGLRSNFDVTTVVKVDQGTAPLLKNATVTINGAVYHTNNNGTLHVTLPYGFLHIVVSKQGYETITKDETLDFDPFFDKLGGASADQAMRAPIFALKSVGIAVNFVAKDWLSGKPITVGKYSIGDVVAQPDPQGNVSLVIPATDAKTVAMITTFGGNTYADTTVTVTLKNTSQDILFVPAGKDYFISKRTGQFAVYSTNLDGSDVATLVPGSANETGGVVFSASPSGKYGVLASTRDSTHDSFGSLQQKLYVVDTATGKLTAMDVGLQFTIVDWQGDTVVYQVTQHNSNGATVTKLASLNITTGVLTNVATAGSIQVSRIALNSVLYLTDTNELHVVPIKGGTDKTLGTNVTKLTQTDAMTFAYLSGSTWGQYNVNTSQVSATSVPASTTRAFVAANSADGQTQLVVDSIDGTPTLFAKAVAGGQETKLVGDANLTAPMHWVGNVAVYRVGTADYAIGASGGTAKKIIDVSPTLQTNHDYFTFN